MADVNGFVNHNIDPRLKGYEWILQYMKAAWRNANGDLPLGCFYPKNYGRYDLLKSYALGRPPIDGFKKWQKATDINDSSDVAIDWTYLPILCKFREIAISKMLQKEYDLECFLIDALAKTEEDEYFKKMFIKITMHDQLQKANSPLANSPLVTPGTDEPQDLEALQMQMNFGYKHNLAMEAEMGLDGVLQQNDIAEKRKKIVEELFDIGLAGYKEWIDENGLPRFRECIAENIISSYCTKKDFSDAVHIGEVVPTMIADLVPYYKPEQIDDICKRVKSQWGNPVYSGNYPNSNWNLFKVMVLDLEFYSYNTTVYKEYIDRNGNSSFEKSDFKNIQFTKMAVNAAGSLEMLPQIEERYKGQPTAKFIDSTRKVIYRGKWIMDTDYMHDYGLAENMNRKQSSWWDTQLSYHLYAWNFHKMRYTGILERLIPVADDYQQTRVKLQKLKRTLIPYMINIDLDALDSAALGKGGKNMTQQELLDFFFESGVAAWRSSGGVSQNPNYKPFSIEASGQLAAFAQLYQDQLNNVNTMYQISGLNEASAESPDPKQNELGINAGLQATNNALYLISDADRKLYYKLADAIIGKLQIAVKLGKVKGITRLLGQQAVKYFEINPDISFREIGLFIRDAMTQQQKQELFMEINAKESQGLLDVSDRYIVESCRNNKQAWEYLNYKVNKNRERAEQAKKDNVALQGQMNAQNEQITAQAKERALILAHQFKMEEIAAQVQGTYLIEELKKGQDVNSATIQSQGRIIQQQIIANAKIATSQPKQLSA